MASYIGQITIGETSYPIANTLYGTCSTENSEKTKTVTLENFDTLITGVLVFVKFTNYSDSGVSNDPVKLKVGTTSAKQIRIRGVDPWNYLSGGNNLWNYGEIVGFIYDGTYWQVVSKDTVYTSMSSAEALEGTSGTSRAITPYTLNLAINEKINALDVSNISGTGAGKTIASLSETDGKIAATFQDISISRSQITDLGAAGAVGVDSAISSSTSTSTNVPTTAAVMSYVEEMSAGITGAMHFIGTTTTALTDGATTTPVTINNTSVIPEAGDVVLYSDKEFVWDGTTWELLGDEGSYALKTSTVSVGSASGWNAGTMAAITKTDVSIPNVTSAGSAASMTKTDVTIPNVTNVGSATTASVSGGTLTITNGAAPTLGSAISATHIDSWSAGSAPTLGTAISATHIDSYTSGTAPSLTVTNTTVVKP